MIFAALRLFLVALFGSIALVFGVVIGLRFAIFWVLDFLTHWS